MTENGMRVHASGTTIKAPTIVTNGTLVRFAMFKIVLVEKSLSKPGAATNSTFEEPIS
jgi:hypothetical protein